MRNCSCCLIILLICLLQLNYNIYMLTKDFIVQALIIVMKLKLFS